MLPIVHVLLARVYMLVASIRWQSDSALNVKVFVFASSQGLHDLLNKNLHFILKVTFDIKTYVARGKE